MAARVDMRKLLLAMMLIVGLIVVAIPVCQMINCTMSSGMMPASSLPMLVAACDGSTMTNTGPVGTVPPESQSLILALAALVGVALMISAPPVLSSRLVIATQDPPAPPEDPRGVRLLL